MAWYGGLAGIIQQKFDLEPFENTLFLFCGQRTDWIKALIWEGDRFLLLYKRLENSRFQWLRNESEVRHITPKQFKWLTESLSIDQPAP